MSADKKNVLLIFTDMQRADTIAALGNPVIKTPNLDRLVKEGTSFISAYTPSPVCVAARCSMQYGLYPTKTGLSGNGKMMEDNNASIPALLGQQGYRTRAVGKCHFSPDRQALRGFDSRRSQEEVTSINDADKDDYIKYLQDNDYDSYEPHGARGEMYYIPQISSLPAEAHPCQWIANESISFMDECQKEEKPFMLMSSFIHPHPPFAPPKPWHKLYRGPDMPLPYVPSQHESLYTYVNKVQNRYKYRDQGIDQNLVRQIKAYYYATISFVDYQVGRMMEHLEKQGILDDTLILFSSDHGEFLGDYHCFGKRSMHDASSKIPMLARLPGHFEADTVCDEVTSLIDFLPTCLGVSGSQVKIETDGVDLAIIAKGESDRDFVFSQWDDKQYGQYMAVTKEWKYFYSAPDEREFLFNRKTECVESRNQAALPTRRGTLKDMRQKLLSFLKEEGIEDAVDGDSKNNLIWRKYPQVDLSRFKDPDSGLLFQDNPAGPVDLPGYSD
jgi:arylsulfatase